MSDMPLIEQLADIELPPAPSWAEFWLIGAIVATGLALILAGVFFSRYRRSRSSPAFSYAIIAQHKLASLRDKWRTQQMSEREIAFHLATLLRLGLGITQLSDQRPTSLAIKEDQWLDILQMLNELRYSPQPSPGVSLSDDAFNLINTWLGDSAVRVK